MRLKAGPFDVVMVWYQNDWGLYGRRNEQIARHLLKNSLVRRVLHIEPPLDLQFLYDHLHSSSLDLNIHTNLRRMNLLNDKGVDTFTPHILSGTPAEKQKHSLVKQVLSAIETCSLKNIILWLYPPHPFAELMLETIKDEAILIVSDCVDDHRQYARSEEEMQAIENRYRKIVSASDVVFTVSKAMRDEMRKYNSHVFYIPNAVSEELIDSDAFGQMPVDLLTIKRPIIGYTGALSMRIDSQLIEYSAKSRPHYSFVLAGTMPSTDIQGLFNLPNIYWLGPKRYDEIHKYIRHFDVCIIPHKVDTLTDFMNPLKLYEYLALGKPVVSTRFAGANSFSEEIYIADNKEDFINLIEKALYQDSIQKHNLRKSRVKCHTWTDRIYEMMELCLNRINEREGSTEIASDQYYSFDRPEIRDLVSHSAKTILDIGCAKGYLGSALKKTNGAKVIGIEINPKIANEAKSLLDDVIVGNIEEKIDNLPSNYFDCVIMADVLEHLRDPETILAKIKRLLKDDGDLIVSVPNVLHWSTLIPLLQGFWDYADAGILDRTHLRFFTKNSIVQTLSKAGYDITLLKAKSVGERNGVLKSLEQVLIESGLNATNFLEEVNSYQYLLKARKKASPQRITSIIILTLNQLSYTKQCLQAILDCTHSPFELIIVDNGSSDGTLEYLRKLVEGKIDLNGYFFTTDQEGRVLSIDISKKLGQSQKKDSFSCRRISVVENGENLGYGKGNNIGITAAQGDYLLILNNDVVVTPYWLEKLVNVSQCSENIGIVGPMTNSVTGPQLVTHLEYNPNSLKDLRNFSLHFEKKYKGRSFYTWKAVGFCLLVKRAVIEKIGGFDERFGLGNFEDDDFCLRAKLAGYDSVIAGDCFVHHFGGATFKGEKIDYAESLYRNWELFKRKWGLPANLAYGTPYDVRGILNRKFFPDLHYAPLRPEEYTVARAERRFEKGDIEGAIICLKRVLEREPTNTEAMNDLGYIAFTRGDMEEAIGWFERGLALDGENPDLLENLGQIYASRGDYERAIPFLEKALKKKPDSVELINALANCLVQTGAHFRAEALYEKSYELNGNQDHVREILDLLKKARGLEAGKRT